jgi:hypothetical protein
MTSPFKSINDRGSILVIVIVYTTVFAFLFTSLIGYLLSQYRWVQFTAERERALHIAEAGIEYYRWRMAHYPNDLTDGTGVPGPYVHVFEDPESGPIGEYSLQIGGTILCGQAQVVTITSTGRTYANPDAERTVIARIARPSVADYSYIVDSNVYAGSSRTITGPYHSNGVVRMDGVNLSLVTSKINTASCADTGLGGCSGTIQGVYGDGPNSEWWRWNQPEIPFVNFDHDFGQLEPLAQSDGIHLPKISNDVTSYGYYLVLRADRRVDIYEVDGIWRNVVSRLPSGQALSFPELAGTINNYRTFIATQDIPQDCPLIYVSDRVWLEGIVSGKVTVVANDTGAIAPDLFIQSSITYASSSVVDGLTVLAERNILLPLYIPDTMTISGIFLAQKGTYGRNLYECGACTSVDPYRSYKERGTLNTTGTIVSKLRTGTAWTNGQGFSIRNDNYDRNLANDPPAMTPFTSPDFRIIQWREVE